MKIELPFNKETLLEQTNLNHRELWKSNLKQNRRRLIWVGLSGLTGWYLIVTGDQMGYLMVGLGVLFLVNFVNYEWYYSKTKKNYFLKVDKLVKEFEKIKQNSIWDFDEEFFSYADHRFESKIKWSTFQGYRLIDNNIFLDFDSAVGQSFILSKHEVSDDQWEFINELVKRKTKPVHSNPK